MNHPEKPPHKKPSKLFSIIGAIIFILILYSGFLLITYTILQIHKASLTLLHYFIPLIILMSTFILLLTKFISSKLFSIIYTFTGILLSMELYMFICSLLYLIINICTSIPTYASYLIITVIPIIICIYGVINVFIPKIEEHTFKVKKLSQPKVRIIHLSDIHLGAVYQKRFTERIVNKVIDLHPDIVVITGDMCDGTMQVLGEWLSPFDILTIPVLYITGNHEQIHGKDIMLRAIETTNITHIGHDVIEVCGINFIGVDYEYAIKPRLRSLAPKYQNSLNTNVLLYHVPCLKPCDLEEFNVFLLLAGHTHGGQVFPCQLPAYCANACFAGLYSNHKKTNHVFVSTGIGASVVPMRIGARSVIGVIVFERDERGDDV